MQVFHFLDAICLDRLVCVHCHTAALGQAHCSFSGCCSPLSSYSTLVKLRLIPVSVNE